ncbi:MAG: hypothetical protein ACKVVP_20325 [Chloroflexota bacterium]
MPRSIRLDPQLEQRLIDVAEHDGVSVSAAAREAIKEYCDKRLETNLYTLLKDYIGIVHSEGGQAERTGEAFTDALLEDLELKRRRQR